MHRLLIVVLAFCMPLGAAIADPPLRIDASKVTRVTPCALSLMLAGNGVEIQDLNEVSAWLETHQTKPDQGLVIESRLAQLLNASEPVQAVRLKGKKPVATFLAGWSDFVDSEHAKPTPIAPATPRSSSNMLLNALGVPFFLSTIYLQEIVAPGVWVGSGTRSFLLSMMVLGHHGRWATLFDGVQGPGKRLVLRNIFSLSALALPAVLLPTLASGHDASLTGIATVAAGVSFLDLVATALIQTFLTPITDTIGSATPVGPQSQSQLDPAIAVPSVPREFQCYVMGSKNGDYCYAQMQVSQLAPLEEGSPLTTRYIDVILYTGNEATGSEPELLVIGSNVEFENPVRGVLRVNEDDTIRLLLEGLGTVADDESAGTN